MGSFFGGGVWSFHDCGPVAVAPTLAWAGVEVVVLGVEGPLQCRFLSFWLLTIHLLSTALLNNTDTALCMCE